MAAVLVTGASSGIGRTTAELLAYHGFTVYAGVRDLSQAPAGTTAVQLDVTNAQHVEALKALDVDALVNNAGIAVVGPLEFLALDELRRQFEVNTIGQLAVTQACLASLRRHKGRIVNLSSISGRVAMPLFGPYAASKYAFEALTDSLRRELPELKISLIEPGAIATPIWERTLDATDIPPQARERYGSLIDTVTERAREAPTTGLPPKQVADVILHALTARRPRTRYVIGRDARISAALAQILPGAAMDRLLARLLNNH
jgi:NAD(P)-dependent dehydrogenase (short-subunit alcohol dehydrogenase family)